MQHAALDQHIVYWSLDVTVFSARCRLRPASQSASGSNDASTPSTWRHGWESVASDGLYARTAT